MEIYIIAIRDRVLKKDASNELIEKAFLHLIAIYVL